MTLFQILTRQLAEGKIKVTRKLLKRLRRETLGKQPRKPRGRKHHGFTGICCAALVAALTLSPWLASAQTSHASSPPASGYSAAALFNRANAFARDDARPRRAANRLNYERAQLLAPNDADIAANLHFERAKAGVADAPENLLPRCLTMVAPNMLAWAGGFGLALAGMSLLLVRLYPRRRWTFRALMFGGALLVATGIGSAIMMWPRVHEAVVINGHAPALATPGLAAEPLFKLREGETVTARAEHQDFTLVRTSAGQSGWVADVDLSRVVPRPGAQ